MESPGKDADRKSSAAAPSGGLLLAFVTLLFFASGFAALLYQVIWQRMFAVFSGVDVYSATIVVAAFMAGLGLGNLTGGHLADRLLTRQRMVAFAVAELGIGGFAFVSKALYYDTLYGRLQHLSSDPIVVALVLFLVLLPPTFLMGLSLPLLARSLTRGIDEAAGTIGSLYAANTVGAAVGALASGWILARTLGFEQTVWLGGAINVACGIGALGIASRVAARARVDETTMEPHEASVAASPSQLGLPAWLLVYALSGFIALCLEIVWLRVVGVLVKPTAFTFGNVLAVYVGFLGLGTVVGTRLAPRSLAPARSFFLLQAAVPVLAVVPIALLVALLPQLEALWAHVGHYNAFPVGEALAALGGGLADDGGAAGDPRVGFFLTLYFALPVLLIAPSTFCMGLSFPYLQRVVQTSRAQLGRRVGWLQTANIVGSMLGAMVCGWVLLHYLGTSATLRLLTGLGAVFLLLHARLEGADAPRSLAGRVVPAVLLVGALGLVPSAERLWSRLHGAVPERFVFAEDGTGVSVLQLGEPPDGPTAVLVNGLGQSWVPFGRIHTTLGALPILMHPDPRKIAVIGLGSGDTAYALGGREAVKEVRCFELVGPQWHTLEVLHEKRPYGGLGGLLSDDRIQCEVADGRSSIMRSEERFDIIEADALRPSSAYAGNLYSREYFELLRSHLAPGGYAVSWGPTPRTFRTFAKVFPHVLYVDEILVGSDEPIPYDIATIIERARHPFTREYFRVAGIDIVSLMQGLRRYRIRNWGPHPSRKTLTDLNTDLFPKDEYLVPERP